MHKKDKQILQEIQDNFPISKFPFEQVAEKFNLTEGQLIAKIQKFKKNGTIRRIAPKLNIHKIEKRVSTLVAMKVPKDKIEKVAEVVNSYKEVSHNYERIAEYNLWFTLSANSEKQLKRILTEIKEKTEIDDIMDLRTKKFFKLGVRFSLIKDKENVEKLKSIFENRKTKFNEEKRFSEKIISISNFEKQLLSLLQNGIEIVHNPFKTIAEKLKISEDEIISTLRELEYYGVIKSFSATLNQRKIGLKANAMIVWKVNENVGEIGKKIAKYEEITHCYERRTYKRWGWNVYSMVHMKSKNECEKFAKKVAKEIGVKEYRLIYSIREFKKTGIRISD